MKIEYRPYICNVCGYKDKIQTNHEGPVLHYCKGCSWKRDFAGKENSYYIPGLSGHTYRQFNFDSSVNEEKNNSMSTSKINKIRQLIKGGNLSEEQKRKLLVGLRKIKEDLIGGETDIIDPDNLQVNEFEDPTESERNPIAKTFVTKGNLDAYASQHRGIEITPKETQALVTEQEVNPEQQSIQPLQYGGNETSPGNSIRITKSVTFIDEIEGADILSDMLEELEIQNEKPTQQDRFFVKYEKTNSFGQNETTIIKKLKEGNQFCWTAFSTYENIEGEDEESGNEEGGNEKNNKPSLGEKEPEMGKEELPDLK